MKTLTSPLDDVCEVIGNLAASGRSTHGMWPSCLLMDTHRIPEKAPGEIPGQRAWDRSISGANLMHDLPTLGLISQLAAAGVAAHFQEMADAYLEGFLARCESIPTGLFPWGEHAFWHLRSDSLGDSCREAWLAEAEKGGREGSAGPTWHDHLRQAPVWFWTWVAEKRPKALQRFADGLDRHWVTDERTEYNRHAGLDRFLRLGPEERSCDFPRHSGFYVLDLACAWRAERRPETWDQLRRFADYWWDKRMPGECLRVESRSPESAKGFFDVVCPSQTLSLAVSLMDAAEVLRPNDPELATELFHRGVTYALAYLGAPHSVEAGRLSGGFSRTTRVPKRFLPVFGSRYGIFPQSQAALLCCAAYRYTGEMRLMDLAQRAAHTCLQEVSALEEENDVPALDAGTTLELFVDLFDLTGENGWIEAAQRVWPIIRKRFFHRGLVCAATGREWYENQRGSGFLLHAAARFALRTESGISIPPDYSAR